MRKMFSQKQIEEISKSKAVEGLVGKDINVEGITSKGIANTGSLGNIGDGVFSGNLYVQEDVGGGEDGNLEVEGAITAKTIKQSEANYLFEFEVNVEDTTNFEKVGTQYCRIEEVNGEIHLIMLARFHNIDTESAHITRLSQFSISNIPTDLSSKIFGYNGPLSENNAGIIRISPMGIDASTSGLYIEAIRIEGSSANTITIYQPTGRNVGANGYITFSLEVNLSVMPSA